MFCFVSLSSIILMKVSESNPIHVADNDKWKNDKLSSH